MLVEPARRGRQPEYGRFARSSSSRRLPVPVFMIERRFAEDFIPDADGAAAVNLINDDEDVSWLFSFLSADKRKTYCLYEADSADSIRRAAVRAGLPADVVIEVAGRVLPDGSMQPVGSAL
jgi:hypothetical protein